MRCLVLTLFFFFFQAEDGIRDYKVTGVQTCALPIWLDQGLGQPESLVVLALGAQAAQPVYGQARGHGDQPGLGLLYAGALGAMPAQRSEERRVGKECRSRWSPYH